MCVEVTFVEVKFGLPERGGTALHRPPEVNVVTSVRAQPYAE
jgi:hypothetical protein